VPEVPEYVVNVKLAEILSQELGIDARAERVKGKRRPDIRCYYRGLIIGIEASYNRSDAEEDAKRRVEQDLIDIALALWYKKTYGDVPEQQLYEAIKNSRFDVKVFIPRELAGTLIPFIEKRVKKVEPATGWFTDIDLPTLKTIVENSVEFLVREEEVAELLSEVQEKVSDFIKVLTVMDNRGTIRRSIYDILYKLYGLEVAEAKDPEVAFGHAALSILLSATFYEHVRAKHPELKPLSEYVKSYGPLEGLRGALEDLLKIDYKRAIEVTLNIADVLPPNIGHRVKDLIDLGIKLASNSSLLRKDFAGRVYHEITGDIALRKGFATFYTEVPAAYLLASLAVWSLLGLDGKDPRDLAKEGAEGLINRTQSLKIGDLACGSGTLLTAFYSALMRLATILKYYHELNIDLDGLGKRIIEEGIYGIDALRYASQITAINLALISPGNITKENAHTIYLGYIQGKNQTWLGSLELLNNSERVGSLLAYIEGGLKGTVERTALEGSEEEFSIPNEFDMIIMNPPFTRATGRTEQFEEGRRGLFGFITEENARMKLVKAYESVRDRVREELRNIASLSIESLPRHVQEVISGSREFRAYLSIGQAGEGLLFLYLAYKFVKRDGVIAFVLPRGLLAGVSWFLARVLLASKFHVKYVIVSSDSNRGYNFSEGTSLSETLIVARRVDRHSGGEDTIFINLLRKPTTALEAVMLAEEIRRSSGEITRGRWRRVEVGNCSAIVFKVCRGDLLANVDNWNRFVAVLDERLLEEIFQLLSNNRIKVGGKYVGIPLVRLRELISSIGIDSHEFHDNFDVARISTPYPVVHGGREEIRQRMLIKPNAYARLRTPRADTIFKSYSGKVLVPDRIWWDTAHVTALYSSEPALSNIFYAVKLDVPPDVEPCAEKALVLWLNTTWGLLTMLINREETRGRWTRLKMAQWRLLPVLEVRGLNVETLRRLAQVFDSYANEATRRTPDQFNLSNPDPVRLGMDRDFIKALDPSIDDKVVEESLRDLYKYVHVALKQWIGEQMQHV
jgi:hypothetical protein